MCSLGWRNAVSRRRQRRLSCYNYQETVLDLVLKMRANPHDNVTARELASNCFDDHRNALNVRGRFDPDEFTVEETQQEVNKALASRASAMTGSKQFSSSHSIFGAGIMGSFCPTDPGQRVLKTDMEDDRGIEDFHQKTMSETINRQIHTACRCGNPLNLSVCSGCRVVYYCSVDRQRKDWKRKDGGHKKMCKKEKAIKTMCDEEANNWLNKRPANLEIQGERLPIVAAREKLRFKVGDVVESMIDDNELAKGVIVATHYREPHWPPSQPSAPYQI